MAVDRAAQSAALLSVLDLLLLSLFLSSRINLCFDLVILSIPLACLACFFVLFCFDSVIYNPLHAARRAMAAAVPLPLAGQQRAFIRKPFPTPNQLARL